MPGYYAGLPLLLAIDKDCDLAALTEGGSGRTEQVVCVLCQSQIQIIDA